MKAVVCCMKKPGTATTPRTKRDSGEEKKTSLPTGALRVGRGLESIPVTAKKAGYTSDRSPVNHRARDRQTFMLKFPPRAKYEFSFNLTLVCVWTVKGSWSTIREPNASMAKTYKPHT